MPHECRITTSRITFLDGRRGGALDDRDLRTTFSMFSGMGLAIEAWKISKAVTVSFEGGRIEWVEASSYKKSNTKEYGKIATSYLLFVTMPLVVVLMGSQHPHPGRKTTTHVLGVLSRDDIVWSNPKFNVNDIRLMTQVDTDHTACVNYIMMSGIRTLRAFHRKASRSWMQSQVFGMMTDDPVPKGSNDVGVATRIALARWQNAIAPACAGGPHISWRQTSFRWNECGIGGHTYHHFDQLYAVSMRTL